MSDLCQVCGNAECACGASPSGLELDIDRRPPAPVRAVPFTAPAPAPAPPPVAPHAPLPIPDSGLSLPGGAKPVIGALIVLALVGGIYLGVQTLRRWGEKAVDEASMRPYPAPNRLVIAAVRSEYGSNALPDGSIILEHAHAGPAAGLAAWYGERGAPDPGSTTPIDEAISAMEAHPTYRALEAPAEPCRSDADQDTALTTLGEVSFGDDGNITVWTCSLMKKGHRYFLAWAARSSSVDDDKDALMRMLKGSQLVDNKLCAMNVVNGGCSANAAKLVASLISAARR